jgi:Leucine-rich repeat (LRR) protein
MKSFYHLGLLFVLNLLTLHTSILAQTLDKDFSDQSSGFADQSTFIQHVLRNLKEDHNSCLSLNLSYNGLEDAAIDELFRDGWLNSQNFTKQLDLSHNRLRMINTSWFSGLRSLENLYLSYNSLTKLDDGVFDNLDNLKFLNLSHNNITEVAVAAFHESETMMVVDMSYNQLTTFEPWPYLLQRASVDLSHNQISSFSNRANYTVDREMLGHVDLSYNNITHWREEDLSMYLNGRKPTAMEIAMRFKLIIRHNPLICDCQLYWVVDVISSDLINKNNEAQNYFFCDAPADLRGKNVGYLMNHGEKLVCPVEKGCPKSCTCLDTPHYGHVAVTCDPALHSYTSLPRSVPETGLLALQLSGHAIRELDKNRDYMDRLQVLDVRGNNLSEIRAAFLEAATSLIKLDARNNQLKSLPPNLQRLTLDKIQLSGNPLECSCDLVWFANWVKAVAANATAVDSSATSDNDDVSLLVGVGGVGDTADFSKLLQSISPIKSTKHLNATEAIADALGLQCRLDGGGEAAITDTDSWGMDCASQLTLTVLVSMGAVLAVLLLAASACWRWRYNVSVLLYYHWPLHSTCCIGPRHKAGKSITIFMLLIVRG